MNRFAWHFDLHCHRFIRINHDPDVEGAAAALAKSGVEEIISFAKCHTGFAYYPTKVGTPHPLMKGDAFGDLARACAGKIPRFLAYISFGIDGEAGRKHPEWVQVTKDFGAVRNDYGFISVCPFTDYMDALMLPMIDEIAAAYPVNGFFFDTMGAMGYCRCEACQKQFKTETGLEIPLSDDNNGWAEYGRFRHARCRTLIDRVGAFIQERIKNAVIGFNQLGTIRYPERLPESVTRLTLDFATAGPQAFQTSLCSAFGSMADRPADVMNTIYNQGWGDWSPRPEASLEQFAVAAWARNCCPYFGDRLRPENRLAPETLDALESVKRLANAYGPFAPSEDAALDPDILVLTGPGVVYGEGMRDFAIGGKDRLDALRGAHMLALDAGLNFAVVAEDFLRERLTPERLVVVPLPDAVDATTLETLRRHAENGGKVLFVGNGAPNALTGVSAASPKRDHVYLPAWKKNARPVLVRGTLHELHPGSAVEVVARAIAPYDDRYGVRYGWGIGPAAESTDDGPILTRMAVGKGEIWSLAIPLFEDYAVDANWTQIAWFRSLIDRVARPTVLLESEAGSVEIVKHQSADATWLCLVNHGGERVTSPRGWARTFGPPPPYSAKILFRSSRPVKKITVNGKTVKKTGDGMETRLELTMDAFWKIVRIDG